LDTAVGVARQSGCIMYVPSYLLSEEYESKLLAHPIIHRSPFMITSSTYTNQIPNAPINLQLFSAVINPRALVIIPQFSQVTQTQPSQCSALNPSPGATDHLLSLTRLQVRINSKQLLPSSVNYGFQQFIENTSKIFSINGGQSSITSGKISLHDFIMNYRYYAFDLTPIVAEDQRDIPQLISFEAFNNSKVAIDLYVFVFSESSVTFDILKGSVDVK
jgi:hypothetical protein